MSAYRSPPRQLSVAPPAPWWRLLRAWLTGTFAKLPGAKRCREYELDKRRMGPMKRTLRHTSFDGMQDDEIHAELDRIGTIMLSNADRVRRK